jgi:hypothetical protein
MRDPILRPGMIFFVTFFVQEDRTSLLIFQHPTELGTPAGNFTIRYTAEIAMTLPYLNTIHIHTIYFSSASVV